MVVVDWSQAEGSGELTPGIYLAEVRKATTKQSKRTGDPYFELALTAVDFGQAQLCFDIVMLAGKGWNIGRKKLEALGIAPKPGRDEIFEADLIGRRVFASVDVEEYQVDGGDKKRRLKVDIKAPGSSCGFWPENDPPVGVRVNNAPVEDDPF